MTKRNHAEENAASWLASILEMTAALRVAEESGDSDAIETARNAIEESALSVQVRNGWRTPGLTDSDAEEYRVLLTTGGPALQIRGALGAHNEPDDDPRLEWQDWGTPWTEYLPAREHQDAVRAFLAVFWYGE